MFLVLFPKNDNRMGFELIKICVDTERVSLFLLLHQSETIIVFSIRARLNTAIGPFVTSPASCNITATYSLDFLYLWLCDNVKGKNKKYSFGENKSVRLLFHVC